MTAAVIDVGSNSVLLLVGVLMAAGGVQVVDRGLVTTRLGEGLQPDGDLSAAAKERTRAAVTAFVLRARDGGASPVLAFATGAVRRARDGAAFGRALATSLGIPVDVLTGDQEAILAYRAACPANAGACAVVDVGGATTEITRGQGPTIAEQVSLPLGALSLTEAFTRPGPDLTLDRLGLEASIAMALAPVAVLARLRAQAVPLVASGGTATAIAALDLRLTAYDPERVHGHRLALATIEAVAAPGWTRPAALDARRADILPAGALVLSAVMRAAGAATVTVSDRGVSYAYLERCLRSHDPAGGVA